MEYLIIDDEEQKELFTLKLRKNIKWRTVIDKVKQQLKQFYNYNQDFHMIPTGKVDLATGESDIKYVCFGIKKTIKIIEK